jgi:sirohydrochlorin cobaltochelatase
LAKVSSISYEPYYLFTGRLIKRIREQVTRLQQQYPTRVIHQADYINDHDQLLDLLDLRLQQCRDGSALLPCDGCSLALAAHHDHHDHHDHDDGPRPTATEPAPHRHGH